MFVYFVRAHVCLSVSVDAAFYFKFGFGRDVDLSLYLDFRGGGFESAETLRIFTNLKHKNVIVKKQ